MDNSVKSTPAVSADTTPKSPWQGTNIYVNLILLVASVFGGMSNDTATMIVSAVAGIIAAFFAVRNFIVNAKWNPGKNWFSDPNNLTYLTTVLIGISPKLGELVPGLKGLVDALISGNWGAIITAGITLISMAYHLFFKK